MFLVGSRTVGRPDAPSAVGLIARCSASDTILVADIRKAPIAFVAPPPVLTCRDTVVSLNASASGSRSIA